MRSPFASHFAPHLMSRRSVRRGQTRLRPLTVIVALVVAVGGCPRGRAAEEAAVRAREARERALLAQSRITVLRSGGIAGLETEATVDGGLLTYAIVTRKVCGTGLACPPPTDAASGAMDTTTARALFARVDAEKVFEMRDDYGTSPTLRDGFAYVVTVRRGDRTKTVRGDDATQPAELARVEGAVFEAIERARGR